MLHEMATLGGENIVSWQPHGKAFRVHQPEVFASTVMPRYFKQQTKYKSFQRQLHLYGFRRINKGIDSGAYFHRMFIRNQRSLSLRMSYIKIKGMRSKAIEHHTGGDPDFYSSATNVDNNLMNLLLQSDPMLQAKANTIRSRIEENTERGCCSKQRDPATALHTGSSDHHADEEKLHFNIGPSPSNQLIVDWMEEAHTVLSREDEENTLSSDGCDTSAIDKGHAVSALLLGVNRRGHEEGLFEGKRFFCVAEAEATTPMMENFSMVVVNGGGPMSYMSRSV
jgi:hypothetical protein